MVAGGDNRLTAVRASIVRACRLMQLGSGREAVEELRAAHRLCADSEEAGGMLAGLVQIEALTSARVEFPACQPAPADADFETSLALARLQDWALSIWVSESRLERLREGGDAALRAAALIAAAKRAGGERNIKRALAYASEAIAVLRGEGAAGALLGEALRLHASALAEAGGQVAEALQSAAEACRLLRMAAASDPAWGASAYAAALHNLALLRIISEDIGGAVFAIAAAVEARRRLAQAAPSLCRADLLSSLTQASRILREAESSEAFKMSSEALELARQLTLTGEVQPTELAQVLRVHAESAMASDEWDAGLMAIDDEIALRLEWQGPHVSSALADAWHNRATFLTMLGADESALSSLDRAIEIRAGMGDDARVHQRALASSHQLAGLLCVRLDRLDLAIRHLETAFSIRVRAGEGGGGDPSQTAVELARVHARLGNLAAAAEVTEAAARLEAGPTPAQAQLQRLAQLWIQAGDLRRRSGDLNCAIDHYFSAASQWSESGDAGIGAGVGRLAAQKLVICLARAGRTDEASVWRRKLAGLPH